MPLCSSYVCARITYRCRVVVCGIVQDRQVEWRRRRLNPPPFAPSPSTFINLITMTIPASPPSSFLSGGDGRLRAVLMRAGTSRGLFLHLSDLPLDRSEWSRIILSAMGSPDELNRKQLNGVGGGVSTQSKVAVCWKSEEVGIDVEYLFIQGETKKCSHNAWFVCQP